MESWSLTSQDLPINDRPESISKISVKSCPRLVPVIYPKIELQHGLPYLPGYWETVYAELSPIIGDLQCSTYVYKACAATLDLLTECLGF
jgi:hypothetical protein